MKKILKLTFIIITITTMCILIYGTLTTVKAATITENELREIIETTEIDAENLNTADLLTLYNEISQRYTNEELADMIEANKKEILKSSEITEDTLDAGTQVLRTTDEKQLRDIINNDLDINEIQSKIDAGYTPSQVISEVLTPEKTMEVGTKLLLANNIVRTSLITLAIEALFIIIVRWVIYKKAGRHGWAILIPIYRDVTYLKVCGLSPWWLLLALVPIVGWFILAIVLIVSRFKMASAFGRGFFFGLGLLFFRAIFELILAVSSKPYIGENE